MVKKAQTPLLLAIILIMIFGIVFYFIYVSYANNGKEINIREKAEIQMNTYTMKNAMDAARLYASTALAYSIYQGCYELLRKGGWKDIPDTSRYKIGDIIYGMWYDSENPEVKPPDEDPECSWFASNLESLVEEKFRIYTQGTYNFLEDYRVHFPKYTIKINDIGNEFVDIEASGNSNLWIESQEGNIHLETSSGVGGVYRIDCCGVYKEGIRKNSEIIEDLKNELKDILEGFELNGTGRTEEPVYGIFYEINKKISWLKEGTFTWLEIQITDHITKNIFEKEYSDRDYRILIDIIDANTEIKTVSLYEKPDETKDVRFKITSTLVIEIEIVPRSEKRFPVFDGEEFVYAKPTLKFIDKIHYSTG